MKRFTSTFVFFLIAMIIFPPVAFGFPYLVEEPPLFAGRDWNVTPSGLLTMSYDLDHNGIPEHFTLRLIIRNFFSARTLKAVAESFPGHPVFFVNYGDVNYYYIVAAEPFMYAIDVDDNGSWDLMYRDVCEDGVNGNEEFYESPSGLFTSKIADF
jgi:hypothetical protein